MIFSSHRGRRMFKALASLAQGVAILVWVAHPLLHACAQPARPSGVGVGVGVEHTGPAQGAVWSLPTGSQLHAPVCALCAHASSPETTPLRGLSPAEIPVNPESILPPDHTPPPHCLAMNAQARAPPVPVHSLVG